MLKKKYMIIVLAIFSILVGSWFYTSMTRAQTVYKDSLTIVGTRESLAVTTGPPTEFNKTYGGPYEDHVNCAIQTGDGGYALAGSTRSFGAGGSDAWLVKTDSFGNMQWNKTYGGTNDDKARSMVETSDGGYAILGYTRSFGAGNSDFWLVKTDAAGNMQWNKTYGGTSLEEAHCAIQTGDGGYALAGSTRSFGAGGSDAWLVKTNSNGNVMWNKTYGEQLTDVAECVIQTNDGGYALAGYTDYFGVNKLDAQLVKTDSNGERVWSRVYGEISGYDDVYCVVQTMDGGYALAGSTESFGASDWDAWLIKVGSNGYMEGHTTLGGMAYDSAKSLIQTSDGGYVFGGYTKSFGAGDSDFWLVKISSEVIPEFPSLIILLLFMTTTLLSVICARASRIVTGPCHVITT